MQKGFLLVSLLVLASAASLVRAEYAEECRDLANTLARTPGALKNSEIDLLKNCLSGLQRSLALGEVPAAATPPPPEKICPPLPPEKECPVCPAVQACPKQSSAPPARDRQREPAVDPLRPQLQRF
jgi:hypothetical protein